MKDILYIYFYTNYVIQMMTVFLIYFEVCKNSKCIKKKLQQITKVDKFFIYQQYTEYNNRHTEMFLFC